MSYRLNKTNGELIVELADGQIDTTSTDVTLVGRNYRGFGEAFNENFIKIIENFANASAPNFPLRGQLWYDTNQEKLKIYNGSDFRAAGSPIVSPSRPPLVEGDLWIDNQNRKLFFYDGNADNEITLVGPAFDLAQGKSGIEVESVVDTGGTEQVVVKILLGGNLFAVLTENSFNLSTINKIDGYPDDPDDTSSPPKQAFQSGINLVNQDSFYRGTAENARAIINEAGVSKFPTDFLPSDTDGTTVGSLTIQNSNGLLLGVGDDLYSRLKISGTTTILETQQEETDIALRTRIGNQFTTPFFADGSETRVGIFNTAPDYTLDLTGDFRATGDAIIEGDLTVNGSATYINVDTLRVLDKNIELGLLDDSTEGSDADINDAGIVVRSTDGSKDFTWKQATNSWTSNVNVNLAIGNEYKINGNTVLSRTELGPLVTRSSLTEVGTLVELAVDGIFLDNNTIQSNNNLTINASGNISVDNSRITDIAKPTSPSDAANKDYVDEEINLIPVYLALDVTGLDSPTLGNPYNDVADILNEITPAVQKEDGVKARVHTTSYNEINVTGINVDDAASVSYISVLSDDSSAVSVVQDIQLSTASGTASPTPTRQTMIFESSGTQWVWQNTN